MKKIGDRVGAIMSAKDGVVRFLGFGVYKGDEVPPEEVGGLNFGVPNPKLRLDSGVDVWGCECWWGSEEKVKEQIKAYDVVDIVDIKELRASESGEDIKVKT